LPEAHLPERLREFLLPQERRSSESVQRLAEAEDFGWLFESSGNTLRLYDMMAMKMEGEGAS
jgi:hypothetical protein